MLRACIVAVAFLILGTSRVGVSAQDKNQKEQAKDKDKTKPKEKEKDFLGRTIGEWIKVLREHDDPKLRWAAVKVLDIADTSHTGLPAIFDAAVKDKDTGVRMEAVRTIARLDPKQRPGGVKVIVQSMQTDKDGMVREVGATMLGTEKLKKAAEDYVSELAGALKDEHVGVRIAAATSLRNIGAGARSSVPGLIAAAANAKEHALVRQAAVHVVSRYGKDNAQTTPLLIKLAKDVDNPFALREIALDGLGRSGSDAADVIVTLAETLTDKDVELRKAAATALGSLGAKAKSGWGAIKDRLAYKIDDKASRAIAVEGDSSVRNHLIRVSGVLGKTAPDAVGVLVNAARHDDSTENRIAAIQELGALGPLAKDAAQPLTVIAQQDGRAAVREAASKAVKSINQ